MGVPKFYRWISERYPCLSEVVREYQIPEFDNLYLDMNGIIHNCSHPNDDDVHFRITEEKIFADIFHYIEVLFRLIRPRKVFLMAIDGVAPRAKMNQQRGRRFRSAQEAARQEAEAKKKGEALPDEERFDSNCITPGTEFMVKLQEQLKFFVAKKVSTDPLWQGCQMILSGHETPGEGEHKIMEYIRYQKSQTGYNANTRHCLYGLDADLMMLGLCTHEPHFSLLREEVRFGGKASQQRVTAPEETTFHLLHLSLMREYLDYEFSDLKGKTPFDYDIEHIIDDWILMGFLVGNDFIPNLPHFHIAKGALPILYRTYIAVLPTLDGYINENGKLNMKRFEAFMVKLSEIDIDYFQDIHENNKFLLSKRSKAKQDNPSFEPVVPKSKEVSKFLKQQALELRELGLDSESDSEGTDSGQDIFNREFIQHKQAYYKEKLDGDASVAYLKDQAESYVRAIQWNLFYYYNGVASWSWYFPHHYAPFVSDITGFADLNLKFDLSKPFLPYEQLLGVLPAASKKLLPEAFQGLMTSQESPIIDFYPTNFETDLNGKQQEWEAVVLIPLIDERRLIKAMAECESYLTDEEKKRNTHGPMYSYVYTPDDLGRLDAPGYFSPIMHNYAKCSLFTRDDLAIEESKILRGLCPGVRLDLYFQGFPTLKHIQHKFYLKEAKVKVFQQPSMGWNMILELTEDQGEFDLEALAKELVGKCVFVEWPHLVEAKVEALANEENHYSLLKDSKVLKRTPMSQDLRQVWKMQESNASERYQNRFGIKIGHTNVLVYAKTLTGRTYAVTNDGRVTLEKSWAKDTSPHPLQTIVRDVNLAEVGPPKYQTLEELYPVNSMCFILTEQYYGAPAEIIEHLTDKDKGKLRVCIEEHPVPSFEKGGVEEDYAAGFVLARDLHISGHLISRITGTIFITSKENKKYNVGLNLKFNKKNEEVLGWTTRVEGEWRYSYKTQDTLREMMQKFPDFFKYIGDHTGDDNYNEADVFPGQNSSQRLKELTTWIAAAPCQKAERQTCGMPCLGSSAVAAVEAGVRQANSKGAVKKFFSKVKPKGLYKPSSYQGSALPDPTTEFQLLDRIINVRDAFCVPQGYLGTIVGIRNWDKNIRDVVLEVVFDKDFPDGMVLRGCSAGRGYLMPSYTLINLSHGERVFKKIGSGAGKESDSVPTGMKMPALPATQTGRGANQAYGSVPPPSGIYQRSPYQQNARQGQTQGSGSRNDELFNPASPRNNNTGRSRDRPPGKEVRRENKPAPEKEFRAPNFQAPMPRPTTVSLTEAAKKLPSPMNFVRGETLVGTTEKPIDDLSIKVFNALRLGSTSAEPKSITFEDLASGFRPPVVQQQTAEVKEQFNPAVQSFLDSAPAANLQLMDMSMRMGMGTPRYEYRHVGTGFQAIVRMPNGQVFEGKAMPNRETASESAARIALTASQQHSPVGYYPFPPQVLASQMNSLPGVLQMRFPSNAFPGQPPFMGFPLGPAPPPPAFAHSQPFQSHRPRTNPGFVPPQVQRQAAGPSKKADEREKKEAEVSQSVTPQQATSVRPNSNQRQRPAQTQSREATKREPRKAKLAAKFSNPPT